MNYTVLGSSGFIGRHLAEMLAEAGHIVYTPARDELGAALTRPLHKIFYCIGLTNNFNVNPVETIEAHVTLLNRILQNGDFEKLVYLSSTRLYDSHAEETSLESNDLTLSSYNPRHLFDLSKALGENLCLNYSENRASVARISSVYGTSADATGFLSSLLNQLKQEKSFTLDSKSGNVRDYINITDACKSLVKIMETPDTGIINVASGQNISNQDIADHLHQLGYDIQFKEKTERQTAGTCDISELLSLCITPLKVTEFIDNLYRKD